MTVEVNCTIFRGQMTTDKSACFIEKNTSPSGESLPGAKGDAGCTMAATRVDQAGGCCSCSVLP